MNHTFPRVAVLAVHGVADQQPSESAQHISDMLLRVADDKGEPLYSNFREFHLRLPVKAVQISQGGSAGNAGFTARAKLKTDLRSYFQFDPRSNFLAALHAPDKGESRTAQRIKSAHASKQSIVQAEERTGLDTLDHQYMREQLESYDPIECDRKYHTLDSVYETTQFIGARISDSLLDQVKAAKNPDGHELTRGPQCEVHIFEMYWADLSRVSSALWRVVIDFYQLLAYLCGIGRKSLDFARAALPYSRWWKWLAGGQFGSEFILTQVVLLMNFVLLGLTTLIVPFKVPANLHHSTGIAIAGLATAFGISALLYAKRERFASRLWPWLLIVPVASAALASLAAKALYSWNSYVFYSLLALGWVLIVSVLILLAMKAYSRRVPGALVTAGACSLFVIGVFGWQLTRHSIVPVTLSDGSAILSAAAETAEWALVLLTVAWFLFVIFAVITSIAGFGVTSFACSECTLTDRSAAKRAVWTVNLTLVASGAVTLIANLAVWKALQLAVEKFGGHPLALGAFPPFDWLIRHDRATDTVAFIEAIVRGFASGWFTIFFCGFVISALIAFWSLFPAVFCKNPPQYDPIAVWLGDTLSAGYRAMRASGEIIRALVLLSSLLVFAVAWFHLRLEQPAILSALGLILFLMLTASQGPLRFLALGFRSVIDIALDVANWLRLHPKDQNPKARISARCVSQLQYLAEWRDPRDKNGYKAFVIIAHSQGTVIMAEILRFLQTEGHPLLTALGTRKVYLFTMGSPLRQLYSLRFPHQYAWARHNAAKWAGTDPNPSHLGLAQWVNAYRSGDYVGRYLWHPDRDEKPWGPEVYEEPQAGYARRERCIGPGEHTHYWDTSAPTIGLELDALIRAACT